METLNSTFDQAMFLGHSFMIELKKIYLIFEYSVASLEPELKCEPIKVRLIMISEAALLAFFPPPTLTC